MSGWLLVPLCVATAVFPSAVQFHWRFMVARDLPAARRAAYRALLAGCIGATFPALALTMPSLSPLSLRPSAAFPLSIAAGILIALGPMFLVSWFRLPPDME